MPSLTANIQRLTRLQRLYLLTLFITRMRRAFCESEHAFEHSLFKITVKSGQLCFYPSDTSRLESHSARMWRHYPSILLVLLHLTKSKSSHSEINNYVIMSLLSWEITLWGQNVQEHLFNNSKSDQWSTCFLPDTQLPCDNINVKVYIYGQVYVQATLTNRSLLSKWLHYNTYQLKLEPIIIWYMTSYETNKIPKMHHITISL